MYSFSYLEPVCCSMSSSNSCFLICISVSQEAGQVVWYAHLFQNFPQFIVIHTVKGFGIVNKAEIDVFLELFSFFHDAGDIGNLISGSSAFSKTSLNMWKFMVHVLLKPGLENFDHYFISVWDERNCEHSLALPFFGMGMKTDLFQSCGHCWVFQICWHIECSTFTESSFRIWNSSTGIPSPPLALFVVMLPKAHLTSHSRMSGSRWVITPSWLSGWWSSFLYSSVYSCHRFLTSNASCLCFCYVRTISVLYWAHLRMKCSLGISNFLDEISSLSHSVVFLYFFAFITEEGFLISPFYSLELCIQMLISFLFSFAFCFSSFHSYLYKTDKQQGPTYTTESCNQYLVRIYTGKEFEKEYIYMYVTESLCCTPETNTTL